MKRKKIDSKDPINHNVINFDPVIESSINLPVLIQIRDWILTGLAWFWYVYLMQGFFSFFIDAFVWAWNGFAETDKYPSFRILPTIASYVEVIIIMELLLVVWSFYNLIRYGSKDRRKRPQPVTTEQMATHHSLHVDDVEGWQNAQRLTMHHDKRSRLEAVEKG